MSAFGRTRTGYMCCTSPGIEMATAQLLVAGLPSLESALLPNVFRFTAKLKISLPKFINHIFHAYK